LADKATRNSDEIIQKVIVVIRIKFNIGRIKVKDCVLIVRGELNGVSLLKFELYFLEGKPRCVISLEPNHCLAAGILNIIPSQGEREFTIVEAESEHGIVDCGVVGKPLDEVGPSVARVRIVLQTYYAKCHIIRNVLKFGSFQTLCAILTIIVQIILSLLDMLLYPLIVFDIIGVDNYLSFHIFRLVKDIVFYL